MTLKKPKGVDELCLLHDCPHKKDLIEAHDNISELQNTNKELNGRLDSITNMMSQGLVDVQGLINKILEGKERFNPEDIDKISKEIRKAFDHSKITEIVNENLNFRKVILSKDKTISELQTLLHISTQESESLKEHIKNREEQDKRIIQDLRNMDKKHDEQLKQIQKNDGELQMQDTRINALSDFLEKKRHEVSLLKKEHEDLILSKQNLNKELKQLFKMNAKAKKLMSFKAKKVLTGCNSIISLKTGKISVLSVLMKRDAGKLYPKLKDAYFALNQAEKELLIDKYDEVCRLMGE